MVVDFETEKLFREITELQIKILTVILCCIICMIYVNLQKR